MKRAMDLQLPDAPKGRKELADLAKARLPVGTNFDYRRLYGYMQEGNEVPGFIARAIAQVLHTTSDELLTPAHETHVERVGTSYPEFERYIVENKLMETELGRTYAKEIRSVYYLSGPERATYDVAEGIHRGAIRRDTGLPQDERGVTRESRAGDLVAEGKVVKPITRKKAGQ